LKTKCLGTDGYTVMVVFYQHMQNKYKKLMITMLRNCKSWN